MCACVRVCVCAGTFMVGTYTHLHTANISVLTFLVPLSSVMSMGGTVLIRCISLAAAVLALSRSPAKDAALPRDREVTTTAINTLQRRKEEGKQVNLKSSTLEKYR